MYEVIFSKTLFDENNIMIYGIKFENIIYHDVSTNKSEVESLVDKCNKGGLSPLHLQDVILDFLNS